MPQFSNPQLLEVMGRFIIPGRKIYVDATNGDDANDGGQNAPYATLARGLQDVRSGRNDFVVYLNGGAAGQGVAEDPIVVTNKSSFGIVGLGFPGILAPTSRTSLLTVTGWTRNSATDATATVAAGHGAVAGDYYFIHGVATSGTARLRGVGRVASVGATTIRFRVHAAGAAGDQPYTAPGALGFVTPCPLAFEQCTQVIVAGLAFTGDLLSDVLSGMVFSGGVSNATISGISVYRNFFGTACLGFYALPAAANAFGSGQAINVQGNFFSPSFTTLTPTVRSTSHLFIQGGIDVAVSDNVMQILLASTTWTGPAFVEHTATNPGAGYSIVGNKLVTNVPAAKFIRSNEANGGGGKIFVEANYYSDTPGPRELLAVDPNGAIFERCALLFPQQDLVPTQLSVVAQGSGRLATFRVTGGTTTAPTTNATQANDFFNNAIVVIYNAAGAAARRCTTYANSGGTFNLATALPFTPASGDAMVILPMIDVATAVWGALRSAHNVSGSFGESVRLAAAGLAASTISAGSFAADAIDANALAANAATEIANAIWGTALPAAFGANTAGERLATTDDRVDVAVSTRAAPGDSMALTAPARAAVVDEVWDEPQAGHVAAGSVGLGQSRLDVAVSTRAAPGDAMDLVTDAVDANAVAASGAAEIAAAVPAAPTVGAIADAVWDEARAGHLTAGTAGEAQNRIDAQVSSRAAPGDAMDLVTDAVDAAAVAASGASEVAVAVDTALSGTHGAGSWATATGFATPGDVTAAQAAILAALAPIQAAIDDVLASQVLAELTVAVGSSATEVRTNAAQADDFYNGAQLVLAGPASRRAVRGIADYALTNGAFTVAALPFTPQAGDTVYVVARTSSSSVDLAAIADAVWDEVLAGHVGAGSAGLVLSEAATQAQITAVLAALATIAGPGFNSATDSLEEIRDAIDAIDLSALAGLVAAVEKIRKVTTNKVEVNPLDTTVTVFEDDGTTPAFAFTISADRRTRTPV